ncbi:uncharacterized protein N0V89_008379 [Didymosphaeria variabile]|uniref:Uncharacterized protein n=1 Tax=Didymosphaeria variabile TaxID=1932322 RepID=A0A9W9C8G6_9PLEO|nr:uncharacterized protein N0V89_008379 [Didymosphaeria variabile]KAJ4349761.1 hypothetical protein N0V89_008379 [Didymosphaeria variabile]
MDRADTTEENQTTDLNLLEASDNLPLKSTLAAAKSARTDSAFDVRLIGQREQPMLLARPSPPVATSIITPILLRDVANETNLPKGLGSVAMSAFRGDGEAKTGERATSLHIKRGKNSNSSDTEKGKFVPTIGAQIDELIAEEEPKVIERESNKG